MFCKICKSLLVPKKTPYGSWLSCPHGHIQPELNQTAVQSVKAPGTEVKRVGILDCDNRLAVYDHKCLKCGHNKAELIERSCSYSDEDNIYQMKCGKCGFIEQLEGKVT